MDARCAGGRGGGDAVSTPARPVFQPQSPDSRCIIAGKHLGWESCTAYAVAMAIDRSTLGHKRPTGCSVRRYTEDTVDGLTLPQCCDVAAEEFGVPASVHVGSGVIPPYYVAVQLQSGRPVVVQGNLSATLNTPFRSNGVAVNHAVHVNEVKGGTLGNPAEALVYDPAADGRTAGWGKADQGPSWWPWSLVKSFAAALQPNFPVSRLTLKQRGITGWYAAIFPDTEPHFHAKFGGTKTSPFPDRVTAKYQNVRVYASPTTANPPIDTYHPSDGSWLAYQKVLRSTGDLWLGSHDGDRWLKANRVSGVGGVV